MGEEVHANWRELCFDKMLFMDWLQVLRKECNMGKLLDGLPSTEMERRCGSSSPGAKRETIGKSTCSLECEFHPSFSWPMDMQASFTSNEIWKIQWVVSLLLFSGNQ